MHATHDAEYRRFKAMIEPGFPSLPPRHRTILVVDDEDIVLALVTRALREAGYWVIQAQHRAAIALLNGQGSSIDLVISDLVMPGVGRQETARWLAAHLPSLPVLFVSEYPTAYPEAHDLLDATLLLLRKPFVPSRLLAASKGSCQVPPGYGSVPADEGT